MTGKNSALFCKEKEIHTAIETCLLCNRNDLDLVMDHIDLFIVDLKIYEADRHKLYTGKSNKIIKENFHYIASSGKKIIVRVPLIKNITDTDENLNSILKFVNETNEDITIEYVNFNPLMRNNYDKLGIPILYNGH